MKYRVTVDGTAYDVVLTQRSGSSLTFEIDGESYTTQTEALVSKQHADAAPTLRKSEVFSGTISAPMPGIVVSIGVNSGQMVEAGATLLVIEAMKMENNLTAPVAGTVTEILVSAGQEVDANQPLLKITQAPA